MSSNVHEGVVTESREVPQALRFAIDPELREGRIRNFMDSLQSASGFSIARDKLRAEAMAADEFTGNVVREMIRLGRQGGTYPDEVVPGEVIETKEK